MFVLLLFACVSPGPDTSGDTSADTSGAEADPTPIAAVSAYFTGVVFLYDHATAAPLGMLAEVPGAQTIVLGPDGLWVVCAEGANEVRRFDPTTFAWVDTLVGDDPNTAEDESGGLAGPTAAIFGPDGLLYVASFNDNRVLRFDDGRYVDDFVPAGVGGLLGPDIGMMFGPDGDLYVPGWTSNAVHHYAADGTYLGDMLTPADGLSRPRGLARDGEGALWVTNEGNDTVLRRTADGDVELFADVPNPTGLVLEAAGTVLVATGRSESVRRYDGETGEGLGTFIDDGGIDGITTVTLLP